jgi:hypothetical protein
MVMSHKNIAKVVWYILVQLNSLHASGRWPLATGHWLLVRSKKPEASSQRPVANGNDSKNKTIFNKLLAGRNTIIP